MKFVGSESVNIERQRVTGPVAIVGIGCRFPGSANSPSAFWDILKNKTCAISEVPSDRWNSRRFYSPHADAPMKAVSKWGGFTREVWDFDAEFFGISPREAEAMDPQQRLFLLVTWEAFEDAGIAPDRLAGSNTGVFVGISTTDYQGFQARASLDTDLSHSCAGAALSIASNRVSNRLDFRGPSVSVDTACSSSLVAVELACRNLWSRDCDVAVAGGVNALLLPQVFINFSKARMLSPTGRVLTFDSRADGFVRAEGAGAVVLKRLEDAVADGGRIYAVITATAVNQDGYTPTLTVPSAEAQAKMLRQVCADAGVRPEDIGYVEAHGTGTPVGDPIEALAIGSVFGVGRDRGNRPVVGSVKTNVGHLEAGAGVCGLIKTALCVYHGEIPPNPNFETISPNIPIDKLNLEIAREHRPWRAKGRRRAVVNSFGFGGTNASAVIEEAPPMPASIAAIDGPSKRQFVVPLSAATATALPLVAGRLADALETGDLAQVPLRDVVGNLSVRRAHLVHRAAIVINSRADFIRKLRAVASGNASAYQSAKPPSIVLGRRDTDPKIAFVFSGQGSQWCGMARKLLQKDSVFRDAIAPIDEALREIGGWSVIEEINRPKASTRIDQTRITQGCIFAVQAALAARWLDWGLRPSLVMGHSLGEIAAAHFSGALSLEDAVKVVHYRSALQAETEGKGAIYAIGLPFEEIEDRLAAWNCAEVALAAINGSQLVSVAGEREAVHQFIRRLKADLGSDIFVRRIRMNFAPHSPQMDVIKDRFLDALKDIRPQATVLPLVSTVTGEEIDGRAVDAGYWWRNIRIPVRFQNAVQTAVDAGADMYIEIGPDAPLSGLVAAALAEAGVAGKVIPSLKRRQSDIETLNAALAAAVASGAQPDWNAVIGEPYNFVELPHYPFEMKQFSLERERTEYHLRREPAHPLLGERLNEASPAWFCELRLENVRYFLDHVIDEAILMPATAYLEMMLSVGHQLFGEGQMELEDVEIYAGIVLAKDKTVLIHTTYDSERQRIAIYARADISGAEWALRIQARLTHRPLKSPPQRPRPAALKTMRHFSKKAFYDMAVQYGYNYEGAFRSVSNMWLKRPYVYAEITTPRDLQDKGDYIFHPALMDAACAQPAIIFAADSRAEGGVAKLYVPQRFKRIRLFKRPTRRMCVFEERTSETDTASMHNLLITDADGDPVMEIEDARALNILLGRQFSSPNQEDVRFGEEDWMLSRLEGAAETSEEAGTWLLFADNSGLARKFANKLKRRKNRCINVTAGSGYRFGRNGEAEIDPSDASQFERLLRDVQSLGQPLKGIVYAWGLDHAESAKALSSTELKEMQFRITLPALYLVGGIVKANMTAARLFVVSAGAKVIPGDGSAANERGLALAPLAGSVRTIIAECPSLNCRLIDLDPRDRNLVRDSDLVFNEVCGGAETAETEIAYRRGQRFVPRYRNKSLDAMPPRAFRVNGKSKVPSFCLTMSRPGEIDNLMIQESVDAEPGMGEVAVAVKAGGLNFRDVMAATGLLPPDAEDLPAWQNLGLEFSGVLTAVGRGVKGLKPGDRVIGYGRGCFRSNIVVPATAVCRMPKKLDFVEAATIPIAFMTAYYGLRTIARLQKGERVLIHLATGGVGLAAIQIARIAGAEIFATAGSAKKRAYLKKLGIKHVMDSRSLAFADEVMEATKGRGVDVILNSLAGPAIDKGMAILAPCGRFVEIGKRDVYMNKAIGMLALRKNASFVAVDLARLAQDSPERLKGTFGEIEDHFNAGRLKPLPTDVFPINKAGEAFHHMASAKHVGKVVITFDAADAAIAYDTSRQIRFERSAAYLVTGGVSGFGLKIAEWLARNGAGHIYLCSRSGTPDEAARRVIEMMRKGGATVTVLAADVAKRGDVDRVLDKIAGDKRELRGVVHAAGVIEDGFIVDLTAERFERAMAPKVLGAWNLHEATKAMKLDHFVLCSSIASVLGTIAQANYVAGNAFMDSLARYRTELGLPGLSINWGALGGTGMVERDEELKKYMDQAGFGQVPLKDSLKALDVLMRKKSPQVACLKINWQKYAGANPHAAAQPRLAEVMSGKRAAGGAARQQVLDAPQDRRAALVAQYLRELVSTVLKVDPSKVDANEPLRRFGLDSLASFQLKNRIESDYSIALDVSTFLQNPNIAKLSEMMVGAIEATSSDETGGTHEARSKGQLSIRQKAILAEIDDPASNPALVQGYEATAACVVSPRIDLSVFRQAFDRQVDENPILRTRFPLHDGRRGIEIADKHAFGLEVTDCTEMGELDFRQLLERKAGEPLDLATGPLYRVHIFHRPDDRDVVLMRSHTIIMDGWSLLLTLRHFGGPYAGWAEAAGLLGQQTMKFSDFVTWQRSFIANSKGRTQLSYWRQKLRGLGRKLDLPIDFPRAPDRSRRGDSVHFILDEELTGDLERFATAADSTTFSVLMAIYAVLLRGHSGSDDIPITTSVAARTRTSFESVVGPLSNYVMIRARPRDATSFAAFLSDLGDTIKEALSHQDYPFVELPRAVQADFDWSASAANQVSFSMYLPHQSQGSEIAILLQNFPGVVIDLGGQTIETLAVPHTTCRRDLAAFVQEAQGRVYVRFEYDASLFRRETIEKLASDYLGIAREIVRNPEASIGRLAVSSDQHPILVHATE